MLFVIVNIPAFTNKLVEFPPQLKGRKDFLIG